MVPTEDAVEALIEYLVAPLLPERMASSQTPPTVDQQTAVGKQMYSVLLLYNYYHRKQFPELAFLDFESFCKVASIAKRSLLMFMKFMHKYEETGSLTKELSIMEKMVMDACNTSSILDASKNNPDMEGWPISQVAVLLVDPKKEKCFLELGTITQGVWSLLEYQLDQPITSTKKQTSNDKRFSNGSSDELLTNEHVLQQLVFSIVEQKTGISHSKLLILGCHMTYSLSLNKTSTMLYIVEITEPVKEGLKEFNIEDLSNSLRGPLVRTGLIPEVTSVVKHYHLLPYLNVLSGWFSRGAPHGLEKLCMTRGPTIISKPMVNENKNKITCAEAVIGESCKSGSSLIVSEPCKENSLSSLSHLQLQSPEHERMRDGKDFVSDTRINKRGSSYIHVSPNATSNGFADKAGGVSLARKPRTAESMDGGSFGRRDTNQTVQDAVAVAAYDLPLVPFNSKSEVHEHHLVMASNKDLQALLRALRKRRDDLSQQQRHFEDEVARCEMNIQAILSDREGNPKLKVESILEAFNSPCSSQMHMGTCNFYAARNQPQDFKCKRISEADLAVKHSVQELDDICRQNCWFLPRYNVLPLTDEGNFQACVTVKGVDFECAVRGDFKSSPREARLSAASAMLSKLCSMVQQARTE